MPNAAAAALPLPNEQPEGSNRSGASAKIDAKSLGVWGISTVVLGNLATLLGTFGTINEQVQKIQKQLNLGAAPYLLYLVLAIIAGGYLLSFTSLYVWIRHKTASLHPRRSVAIALVVFAGGITAAAVNVWVLPTDKVKPVLLGRIPIWRQKIISARDSHGGFTIMLDPGPSNPPQVLTSAQAITALQASINWANPSEDELNAIRDGLKYIDSKRSPTEGCWGYFDNSQPLTEVCAWVIIARTRALEYGDKVWRDPHERTYQLALLDGDLESMISHYDPQMSGWSPFRILSRDEAAAHSASGQCLTISPELATIATLPPARTYSSVMAVWALLEVHRVPQVRDHVNGRYDQVLRDSIGGLLLSYQKSDIHSWVPNPYRANQREEYLGLTAQTIAVLYLAAQSDFKSAVDQPVWKQVRHDFLAKDVAVAHQLIGDNAHLSDVDGYIFPYPHPLEPITFLWSPWTVLAYKELSQDPELQSQEQETAKTAMEHVLRDYTPEFFERLESGPTYEMAENLYGMSTALR